MTFSDYMGIAASFIGYGSLFGSVFLLIGYVWFSLVDTISP